MRRGCGRRAAWQRGGVACKASTDHSRLAGRGGGGRRGGVARQAPIIAGLPDEPTHLPHLTPARGRVIVKNEVQSLGFTRNRADVCTSVWVLLRLELGFVFLPWLLWFPSQRGQHFVRRAEVRIQPRERGGAGTARTVTVYTKTNSFRVPNVSAGAASGTTGGPAAPRKGAAWPLRLCRGAA